MTMQELKVQLTIVEQLTTQALAESWPSHITRQLLQQQRDIGTALFRMDRAAKRGSLHARMAVGG